MIRYVMKTKLSVNLNKFALIRNARGNNMPDILQIAKQCLALGANGITVHPRPDERHIRFSDLAQLLALVQQHPGTQLNIEGYPCEAFIEQVCSIRPHQVTLVPDPPGALTSAFGWNIPAQGSFLQEVLEKLRSYGIVASIFLAPKLEEIIGIEKIMPQRVELYTYDYAQQYNKNREQAIAPFMTAAQSISEYGIGLNAGHDLNLDNVSYFLQEIPVIQEVSIGHALVCDCLAYGLDKTIKKYLAALETNGE